MVQQQTPVPVSPGRLLREKLAARVDSSAEMVEGGQPLSLYLQEDLQDRQRLVNELECTFSVPINASDFEKLTTVGDLAALINSLQKRPKGDGRTYIVIYRTTDGRTVEEHVRAANHEAAIELLRATASLEDVLSVSREEDEDRGSGIRHVRNGWNGCVIPFTLALLGAAGVVLFFWLRSH